MMRTLLLFALILILVLLSLNVASEVYASKLPAWLWVGRRVGEVLPNLPWMIGIVARVVGGGVVAAVALLLMLERAQNREKSLIGRLWK